MALKKLTPELLREMVEWLRMGMPIKFSCARVGIHHDTYYDWMKKANEARAVVAEGGHQLDDEQQTLIEFADTVELARNFGGSWLYEKMLTDKDWIRYCTALERQFHDIWTTRQGAYSMTADRKDGVVEVKLSFQPDAALADEMRVK